MITEMLERIFNHNQSSKLRFFYLLLVLLLPMKILAIAPSDRHSITYDTVFYDPRIECESTSLIGADNAEKIWNFLISKGFQPFQVAGFMGNIQAESGFNPRRIQGTPTPAGDSDTLVPGKGYGIAQWTDNARQQALLEHARAAGKPEGDLGVQLDYLWFEITEGRRAGIADELKATATIEDASNLILFKFEAPQDQGPAVQAQRLRFANNILSWFGSNPGPVGPGGSAVCGPTGTYVLPLDRHWYDDYPERFTGPHHDYPAVDIGVPNGTPIYSISAGKIISITDISSKCGLGVIVDAGDGIQFSYCHGQDAGSIPGARAGDQVSPGQLIMNSDNTGNSRGPHLHLGIKVDGQQVCPQSLLVGIAEGSPPDIRSLPTSGCTYVPG